jgi:hypothetical protein
MGAAASAAAVAARVLFVPLKRGAKKKINRPTLLDPPTNLPPLARHPLLAFCYVPSSALPGLSPRRAFERV